ncbi:magnesium transporter [Vibrio jasicida]|uniref:magnesium transporter n=1 Tax=Vibrio jasicida TaxID=766224 RepID=UPI0003A4A9E2|nr:magnesium transporter [Vibrio jasicida]
MNKFQELSLLIEAIVDRSDDSQVQILTQAIKDGIESGAIAHVIEAIPIEKRGHLWRSLPQSISIDVLTDMRAEVRLSVISTLSENELKLVLSRLDNLSLIEWSETLPDDIVNDALGLIAPSELDLYTQANTYSDIHIGRWANNKITTLPFNISIEKAKMLLARNKKVLSHIYLINRKKQYKGIVRYIDIMSNINNIRLDKLTLDSVTVIDSKVEVFEAVEALEQHSFQSLPIVDSSNNILIGEIDWKFALEKQRELYESRLMAGTGMNEDDDLFSPIVRSSQKRGIWLGINLLTAVTASVTIGLFENVITQIVALAVLMPIVASMGGIAGSQTLTLMIRAMALDQITSGNRFALLKNELGIGIINGILWAIVIGSITCVWFESSTLGIVISLAIVINIISASIFGVLIPVVLDKFKLDPALAGSVILTTITDVVGFFTFLGTASIFLT